MWLRLIFLAQAVRGWTTTTTPAPRLRPLRAAAEEAAFADFDAAETAALGACKAGDYAGALSLFEEALTLPGDGYDVRRVSTNRSPINGAVVPRDLEEVRFASTSQRQTTFYNMACCHAKMGNSDEALENLEKALTLGFDDFALVTGDGDFASIADDVNVLVQAYKPKGFFETLLQPLRPKS